MILLPTNFGQGHFQDRRVENMVIFYSVNPDPSLMRGRSSGSVGAAVQFDSLRLCFRPEAECTMTLRKPQRPEDSSSGDTESWSQNHPMHHSFVLIGKEHVF